MAVDLLAERVARRHDAGVLARFLSEPQPARRDGARDIVGFDLGDVAPQLLERASDVALEARFDGFLQGRIALAHDLVHDGGLHPGGLELGEGLAGVDRIELFRVAHQHHAGHAEFVRNPEQVARLHGRGERAFVDHQDGLREGGAHLLRALLRKPALGDAGVAREEHLEGFGLDTGLGRQGLHRRGRRREADRAVALLCRQHPGPVEHGGLAAAGITLHPDHPVLRRQDQLHGVLLPGRERPLVEVPLDLPASHRRGPAALAGAHRGHRLAFLGDGLRGGEASPRRPACLPRAASPPSPGPRPRVPPPRSSPCRAHGRARPRTDRRGRTPPRAPRDAPSPRQPLRTPHCDRWGRRPDRRHPGSPQSVFPAKRPGPAPAPARASPVRRSSRRPPRPAPGHRARDRRPVSARRPAIPRGRCPAWRRASSAPPARPIADCRRRCRDSAPPSPPRSRRAGSRRPRPPRGRRRRSRSARRHGSSRCRSRASQDRRQTRCGRACRSASGAHTGPRWPSNATCRPRPAPCWRARHGCAAADRDCARCRGGRWRRRSSDRPRGPSAPSRGPSSLSRRRSSRSRPASPSRRGRAPRRCGRRRRPERRWRRISGPRR